MPNIVSRHITTRHFRAHRQKLPFPQILRFARTETDSSDLSANFAPVRNRAVFRDSVFPAKVMKSNNRLFRTCASSVMLAACLFLGSAADAAQPAPRAIAISEHEFAEAFARRERYEEKMDTIVFARICGIIRNKIRERLNSPDADAGPMYLFRDSDSNAEPIFRFPYGLLAVCVCASHEEREYWFFDAIDCKFVARTGTLPKTGGIEHCVSKGGYMVAWQNHAYDSKADLSLYRLQDGCVEPIARYPDVPVTIWERVCWGADNTFYLRGVYNCDDESPAGMFVEKFLKFEVPRE